MLRGVAYVIRCSLSVGVLSDGESLRVREAVAGPCERPGARVCCVWPHDLAKARDSGVGWQAGEFRRVQVHRPSDNHGAGDGPA